MSDTPPPTFAADGRQYLARAPKTFRNTNTALKDLKKNQGENMPWGQGDTPITEVLQLLKRNKWPIPAYIEYEYRGTGTPVEEVKKGFDYMRQALA